MLGRHIHPNLSLPAIFNGAMHGTLCPELPADAPPAWSALMNACCSYQPADRPSFSDAAEHLERIVASLTAAEAESQRVTV
ncbi:hypothetical protein CVIRNUC_009083 [Coccomyxa viridis]|uniref:Serine-threonine/tyrosine-protein kinase catalytic domain-containing protein n=1 Tax=Coccomyxa viridis TaxID=1274662 RepID=A0AAV1IIL8_9CHLO|nr:hypothetical protein CVIRNUC_009083 [Coccomyxa viridis]